MEYQKIDLLSNASVEQASAILQGAADPQAIAAMQQAGTGEPHPDMVQGSTTALLDLTQEPAKPPAPTSLLCPHCGHMTGDPVVKITDEDKRLFLRSLRDGEPFIKEEVLFGGTIRATFRTRWTETDKLCEEQCLQETKDKRISGADYYAAQNAYVFRYRRLLLACSIQSLTGRATNVPAIPSKEASEKWKPRVVNGVTVDNEASLAYEDLFGSKMNDTLYAAIFGAHVRFEQMIKTLLDNAQTPNFWPGIVGPLST